MNKTAQVPLHEHDCATCVFLGRDGELDLYIHVSDDPIFTTVIARFGKEGDYYSGLAFADRPGPLAEARRRAIDRGFGADIAAAEGGAA